MVAFTNSNRRHQLGIGADKHIVANNRFEFVRAIIVTGDGPRADIHVVANFRIAQVGQMAGFRTFTQTRFFISTKLPT